jgi:hypothetical protein
MIGMTSQKAMPVTSGVRTGNAMLVSRTRDPHAVPAREPISNIHCAPAT